MNKTLGFFLATLTLVALVLLVAQGLGLMFVQVRGPSMTPSYADGQVLFVNRLAYGLQGPSIGDYWWIWKAPNLGDPVVLRRDGENGLLVKRVAGLPGMDLKVEAHSLWLGSRQVKLTPSQEYWLSSAGRVPSDSIFVLGDNVERSLDSRDWGFVRMRDVLGRSLF